jgi:hypothetical protein
MSDKDGWKRGAKGIDGNNKGQYEGRDDFKMPKSNCAFGVEDDYGANPVSHRLAGLVDSVETNMDLGSSLRNEYWKSGPIKRVGDNARPPKGYYDTHPVKANSPSGKYAKKGGTGQRSGS